MFLSQDVNANGRAPHDDFWYHPIGGVSAAGVRVSAASALTVSALYACAQVLGQTVGVAPVHLLKRLENGGKERAVKHPLYRLIHRQPNRWQTAFQWRQMMQWHLALRYNAYSEKLFDRRGDITALIPLHPDRVIVERFNDRDGMNFRYRVKDAGGSERVLVREEMFHIRGLSSDGIEGFSVLELQADSIGEAIAAQRFGARRLKNDARPGGVLEWDGHFNTDEDRRKWRTSWQDAQSKMNQGMVAVLERGMSWKEVGIKNTDLQYIELRKLKNYDIAAIYRMPPHKIGIMDRATFTNIEHQGIEFTTDTMLPWFVNWEQELSLQLLQDDEHEELFFETLVDGLLRGDAKARADYYSKGILDGWLTRNEARIAENRNPLDGLDKPLEPMNMRKAGEEPKEKTADAGSEEPAQPPADDESESALRVRALNAAAVDRVLRKEVEMVCRAWSAESPEAALTDAYARHKTFVVDVLIVPVAAAADYCLQQLDFSRKAKDIEVADLEIYVRRQLEQLVRATQTNQGD